MFQMTIFSIPGPSKIYPNWYLWFEKYTLATLQGPKTSNIYVHTRARKGRLSKAM
jgi:hypothetical protein